MSKGKYFINERGRLGLKNGKQDKKTLRYMNISHAP